MIISGIQSCWWGKQKSTKGHWTTERQTSWGNYRTDDKWSFSLIYGTVESPLCPTETDDYIFFVCDVGQWFSKHDSLFVYPNGQPHPRTMNLKHWGRELSGEFPRTRRGSTGLSTRWAEEVLPGLMKVRRVLGGWIKMRPQCRPFLGKGCLVCLGTALRVH